MGLRSRAVKSPKEKIKDARKKGTLTQLQFPQDLGAFAFVINFQKYSYVPNDQNPLKIDTEESILLPLPANLSQDYRADIKQSSLGALGQATALAFSEDDKSLKDESDQGIMGMLSNIGGKLSDFSGIDDLGSLKPGEDTLSDVGGLARGLQQIPKLAGRALLPDFAVTGLEAGLGNIFNPVNIASFKGNPIRTHDLNWKLIPRNKSESETLNKIVKIIRYKMHSTLEGIGEGTEGQLIQQYPDIISCALITPDVNNSIFYKPGLISDFSVNHSGKGDLNFFNETHSPVNYDIKLKFSELDFITRGDFDELDKENSSNTSTE